MKSIFAAIVLFFVLIFLNFVCGPATPVSFWLNALQDDRGLISIVLSQNAIFELRLVHIILASATGFALATAGRSMQNFLQNTLADPHVVGLSAGSTTAVLLTILFAPTFAQLVFADRFPALWLSSLVGSVFAFFVLRSLFLKFARVWGPPALALSGLFLNAGLSALLMVIFARLSPSNLSEVQSWTLGAIQPYSIFQSVFLLPFLLLPSLYLIAVDSQLVLSSLGQDFALSNGIETPSLRTRVLIALMVLSSASVCAAGSVGFVGLLVPHLTRRWMLFAPSAWMRPVFNGLMGACVLLCADLLSRTLTSPGELPVGVYTALFSVPFLFLVLARSRREVHSQ